MGDSLMPVVNLACEFRYESAHYLTGVPADHKCAMPHGHSYHLTVIVSGPVCEDGFVIDFDDVKKAVGPLVAVLDHQSLNSIEGLENPTVEIQLIWLWERLADKLPLKELRLRETANNSASYFGE